jgi:hypothetical protein
MITSVPLLSGDVPKECNLSQNYPNPFNPVTVISFRLSAVSDVKLIVYDVLGRKVATLVEGEQRPGTHSVQWDASGFSSGTYFCRMEAGQFHKTLKLVLMK